MLGAGQNNDRYGVRHDSLVDELPNRSAGQAKPRSHRDAYAEDELVAFVIRCKNFQKRAGVMKARIIFFATLMAFGANVLAASPAITTDPTFVDGPTPPKYPASAIKERQSGTVRVEVSIDKAGQVSAVELAGTSGSAVLDAVAIERAWHWKFNPATENGEPVESRIRVPVIFSLDGTPGETSGSASPATAADPGTAAE